MERTEQGPVTDDEGFSLIEIVVSMFLIAFLAMAFAPVLVQSMTTSVRNTTIATGTQLLNRELDRLRATPAFCDTVTAFGAAAVASTTDSRGVAFQPVRSVEPCPTTYPGVVRVTISVTTPGVASTALTARTLFYVDAATEPTS
jgi:prepilin-type N-terminal cleavage/methylation domain-containing protein